MYAPDESAATSDAVLPYGAVPNLLSHKTGGLQATWSMTYAPPRIKTKKSTGLIPAMNTTRKVLLDFYPLCQGPRLSQSDYTQDAIIDIR
jgi:hypothetical protein